MKKISFFVAIAAAASLASCTAQAPKANMKNDVDSLSYMMGITNTQGLDMYMSQQLGVDTAYMADFIRGVKEGTSKTSPKDVAYMAGLQIGQQVGGRMFDMMSQRIFGNDSTQSLSKENFLAGFMAALQKKGMNVTMEEANAYVQSKAEAIKTKATEAQFAENKAAYHFGNKIDMVEALKEVPADALAMGNLDPVSLFKAATPEVMKKATLDLLEATKFYPNFVLSSGCDTPPHTPSENIDAFFAALNGFNNA